MNLITTYKQANYDQTQLKSQLKQHICKKANQLARLSCQTTSY